MLREQNVRSAPSTASALLLLSLGGLHVAPVLADDSSAVIFMYHRFGEDKYPSTSIQLAQFKKQLALLREQDVTVLPLSQVVKALKSGEPLPPRTVALTVDDAYLSVYEQAAPILKDFGWQMTVFVSTASVDKGYKSSMSWEQMRELESQGFEFANHTVNHPHLVGRLEGESDAAWLARVRKELLDAQARLDAELKQPVPLFAYPYGEYNQAVAELVSELGYVGVGQQSGASGPFSDFRVLPRFPVSDHYGELNAFKTKSLSLPLAVKSISPDNPEMTDRKVIPSITVDLVKGFKRYKELACYATGQGKISTEWLQAGEAWQFKAVASKPFTTRRGRINCTAPSDERGRFYWFSYQWVQLWKAED